MERLTILVGRLYKSVTPTNYFFKVQLVGRFMPLVGVIGRLVESPLDFRLIRRVGNHEKLKMNNWIVGT